MSPRQSKISVPATSIEERYEVTPYHPSLKRIVEKKNNFFHQVISRSEEFHVETPREKALLTEIISLKRDVERLKAQMERLSSK